MQSSDRQASARGFSLPELLIVIAIIVILAAVLMPFFLHARDDAMAASCESNEQNIAAALDSYAVDHGGRYPSTSGPVDVSLFGGPGNPYMQNDQLIDPADGQPYEYIVGQGGCQNPDAMYQIIDTGGHASPSLVGLLRAENKEDSIAFCSDLGLYAFDSHGAGSSSALQPRP
jgi:prepilin-type N-terminal cleavage/methylation domain-containing protein